MNSKIIIYDDSCPLCSAYTQAFVKTGLISKEGRKDFSTISPELLAKIDTNRSVNEIPVIDTATNQVWYGIDALLEILQQKIPFIKTLGNLPPLKWGLKKLYRFISYNRRVIVAAGNNQKGFDCTPDFNSRYRLLFILFFLSFNTVLLFPIHQQVLAYSLFSNTGIIHLQLAHATLVLINICIAATLAKKEAFEYAGQVTMLALLVVLILIPLVWVNRYGNAHSGAWNSFYLGMLTLFVSQEYWRRMHYTGFIKKYPLIIALNILSVLLFIVYLAC